MTRSLFSLGKQAVFLPLLLTLSACSMQPTVTHPPVRHVPLPPAVKNHPLLARNHLLSPQERADLPKHRSVSFRLRSLALSPQSLRFIAQNSRFLQRFPDLLVQLQGNTEPHPMPSMQLAVGDKLAWTVRLALVAEGVSPTRISVVTFGDDNPVCRANTEGCYRRDRRVTFVYSQRHRQ